MSLDDETGDRILEKATYIEAAVDILAETQSLDRRTSISDREQRDIVDREFQTAIEACIDIASLLCRAIGTRVPEQNAAKFDVLVEQAVGSTETARRMKEAAGVRNVLAHRDGGAIDDSLVDQSVAARSDGSSRRHGHRKPSSAIAQ